MNLWDTRRRTGTRFDQLSRASDTYSGSLGTRLYTTDSLEPTEKNQSQKLTNAPNFLFFREPAYKHTKERLDRTGWQQKPADSVGMVLFYH